MAGKSYVHGKGEYQLKYTTLCSLLDYRASQCPNKEAYIYWNCDDKVQDSRSSDCTTDRKSMTFRDVSKYSLTLAGELLNLGLLPGDRVAIIGTNCPEWLFLEYAVLRINIILVRIPPSFVSPDLLVPLLTKHQCKALFLDPGYSNIALMKIVSVVSDVVSKPEGTNQPDPSGLKYIFLLKQPNDDSSFLGDYKTLEELMKTKSNPPDSDFAKIQAIQDSIDPEGMALIFPTSGTTGFPKFVIHSHFSYVNNVTMCFGPALNFDDPNSVFFNDRPYSWIGGYQFVPALFGVPMVHLNFGNILDVINQTSQIFNVMNKEKVTAALTLPYWLHDAYELSRAGTALPPTLQYTVTGGETIPEELLTFGQQNFKCTTLIYGSTECLNNMRNEIIGGDIKKVNRERNATASFSNLTPFPLYEVKLLDDQQNTIARNESGNLWIRSVLTSLGYLDDPESYRSAVLSTGWFKTGDVGRIDDTGSVQVIGRTKDIISKGTTKVYPKTVERILLQCCHVDKAVVVGVPHPRLFNELCACVILTSKDSISEIELEKFCQNAFLVDSFLVPKYYWIVEKFPQGATGKIDRIALKIMATKHFNL